MSSWNPSPTNILVVHTNGLIDCLNTQILIILISRLATAIAVAFAIIVITAVGVNLLLLLV